MLTREEYNIIAQQCRSISVEPQTNYYFDTDDFYMNSKGITCRLRAKKEKYKVTIKNHRAGGSNCSVEEDIYEGKEYNTKAFEALGLQRQGTLVTQRIVMYRDVFCEVVLDQNSYLGITDYELEVEYAETSEKRALEYLQRIADCLVAANLVDSANNFMLRIGKEKTKSERFFEKKRSML